MEFSVRDHVTMLYCENNLYRKKKRWEKKDERTKEKDEKGGKGGGGREI